MEVERWLRFDLPPDTIEVVDQETSTVMKSDAELSGHEVAIREDVFEEMVKEWEEKRAQV